MFTLRRLIVPVSIAVMLIAPSPAFASSSFTDVNPDVSNNTDPDAATGGRVNGLAVAPGGTNVVYAASELGGLFRSTNSGANWARLNGHLPTKAWDVLVDPSNANRVYATSWYDGRENSISGIQVSTDAGATWTHPATATPTGIACTNVLDQPQGYGIAVRPGAVNEVYAGAHCGLARSTDSGSTWTFLDPEGAVDTAAAVVWDVVVQAGGPTNQGIIDVCGDKRHWRSTDGGTTWTGGSANLPAGRCSIAASPDESYVLFVYASDNNVYESDDGGANWTNLGTPDVRRQGRIPFVVTNQRANAGANNVFDLWTSDVSLFRTSCTTPATPAAGGTPRCPAARTGAIPATYTVPTGWFGPFTRTVGAHDDAGDLEFSRPATGDPCPLYYASDGGFHNNTDQGADCQNPNWNRSNVGLHALWLWTLDGSDVAGTTNEDLYFGTQDDGSFGTTNAGATPPTWNNPDCCDVFVASAQPGRVVYVTCCGIDAMGNLTSTIRRAGAGITAAANVTPNPPGNLALFQFYPVIDDFGDRQFVVATSTGVYVTNDITAASVTWTQLGAASSPANTTAVWAAVTGGTPTFYTRTNTGQIWRFVGTGTGSWTRVDNTDGLPGGTTVFTVNEANPNRLAIADNAGNIFFSNDAGQNWAADPELDTLVTANGFFRFRQPTLLAFDPENANFVVAGGQDSGVFLSTDGGANWGRITDPINSAASGRVHLPEPRHAYFDHEPAGTTQLYIGSRGRGVFRFDIRVPTADAGGPYTTAEGTDVVLDGTGSTDPDAAPLTYEWDFDDDGQFDDAVGATPTFDRVGRDGVFPVALKVTAGGVVDTDSTTVTVTNVPPSVTAASDAPKPELQTVTVAGVISDPGWLDPLSGTIDWGDGTSDVLTGVVENVRPNATLTYSATHVYGDDGTFSVRVCGSDDDVTRCTTISVRVTNVNPSATIDESGATIVNGQPAFITRAGTPVTFRGRSTDPGSDDLTLSWSWGDGPPAPDVSTTYLVNPPNPDPDPSPTIQPRDVTDTKVHAFADACLYRITFSAADDDGGTASDGAVVLVTGTADRSRSSGNWHHQFSRRGRTDFTDARLQCYLDIVQFASRIFSEIRDASTIPAAFDVLDLRQNGGSEHEKLDRELLTAWLNFADGSIRFDQLIDTNRNGVPETPFSVVMANAERVRADPTATTAELRQQRQLLQQIK